MTKRAFVLFVSCMLLLFLLAGCTAVNRPKEDKIRIVCTIFPQYDWVRQILGDRLDEVELTLLLSNRIDLHNYQPSVDDIVTISTCDLFVYVGGESDRWVDNVLKDAVNKDILVISLLDLLGESAKIEEIVDGMEDEGDEEGFDEGDAYDDDGEEYDEHVWLSLHNAMLFCRAIDEALSTIDPNHAKEYHQRLASYLDALLALDAQYQTVLDTVPVRTLLFGDRFPFRYLVDDYGLDYFAAFPGCSAETEASFNTIIFLSEKMDELSLPCVMVTESADQSIAKTIIQNTSAKNESIFVLDSMQSIASEDLQNGVTYLSIMESNLNVLKEALQ